MSHQRLKSCTDVYKANSGSQITKVNFNTRYKLEWDNLDSEAFNALITNELFMYNLEEKTSEDNINFLCRCLKRATTCTIKITHSLNEHLICTVFGERYIGLTKLGI